MILTTQIRPPMKKRKNNQVIKMTSITNHPIQPLTKTKNRNQINKNSNKMTNLPIKMTHNPIKMTNKLIMKINLMTKTLTSKMTTSPKTKTTATTDKLPIPQQEMTMIQPDNSKKNKKTIRTDQSSPHPTRQMT